MRQVIEAHKKVLAIGAAVVLAVGMAAAGPATASQEPEGDGAAEVRLESAVERAIRTDGPFFDAGERALVERACGLAAGSWDGFEVSMDGSALRCPGGRRVDDPQVRAMMEAAAPRIARRVAAAMARPEVRDAIAEVTREATAAAMRGIDQAAVVREAAAQARVAVAEARVASEAAFEEARRAMNDPEVQRAIREAHAAAEQAMRDVGPEVERALREAEAEAERAAQEAERAAEQARGRRRN